MEMKRLLFALLCVAGCAGLAHAGCTQEELVTKAQEFSTLVQQVAQKDPQKYQEVAQAMQKDLPELQKNAQDTSKLCEFYDTWTAKLK
jgi:transketolase